MTAPKPSQDAVEIRSAELEVYTALRRQIIRRTIPGGALLRLAPLADRFGVSTMPVRAAVARLQAEGLVTQRPRRGATVTELTASDFRDLYAIREGLEGAAARYGVTELTDEDIDAVRNGYAQLTAVSRRAKDTDRYIKIDRQLHDVCYRAAARPQLLQLIDVYRRNAERYFHLYMDEQSSLADELELQELFVSACARRNGRRAEAAVLKLFGHTIDRVLPHLSDGA